MEQEPKQKGGPAIVTIAAVTAVCLLLTVMLTGARAHAVTAWSLTQLDYQTKGSAAVQSQVAVGDRVIPVGRAVGIKLFSDGVLVVGLSGVETEDGAKYPGRDSGLKAGDVITHINGDEVDTIEQIQDLLAQQEGEPLTIQAMRGQRQLQLTAEAVENCQGVYQLGVWLRDSMAGIGTITFYDPSSGVFGALGHGINDVDTAMLMPMESGSIMKATVSEVQKGLSGQPGELHGQFDLTQDMGSLYANTEQGIFGRMNSGSGLTTMEPVEVATREEIHTGPATILSNIRGDTVEEFAVTITHVASEAEGTRGLMVEVTDPALLQATGGIVQGMSGSPIIQNGKLVGAVTHVLVNDPTRGYGIFIESMLKAAEN
ncbi:MAG: SpoIVB peptidase [Lawsonibacter sp.]